MHHWGKLWENWECFSSCVPLLLNSKLFTIEKKKKLPWTVESYVKRLHGIVLFVSVWVYAKKHSITWIFEARIVAGVQEETRQRREEHRHRDQRRKGGKDKEKLQWILKRRGPWVRLSNRSTNTKRENRSRIKIIGNCTEASSADALDPQWHHISWRRPSGPGQHPWCNN